MLTRLSEYLRGLRGRRRALVALILGASSALALPPFHLVPILVPAFVWLMWLLDGTDAARWPWRAGMWTGFWFGFGHALVGVHWIAEPLLVDPARTVWLIPLALPGLAAALAAFPALTCALLVALPLQHAPVARVGALAALWTLSELLRGYLFTGFPWNLLGYVWAGTPATMQAAALMGVLGLTLVTVLAAAMPAVLAARDSDVGGDSRTGCRRLNAVRATLVATLGLPVVLWVGGAARLAGVETTLVPDVRLRLVQANIAQRDKWNPELRTAHLDRHLALSGILSDMPPTHVIWPETAVPFLLPNDTLARIRTATAVPAGGRLITGSVRSMVHDEQRWLHNALVTIDAAADIERVYDKSHLVPFGEYVPLRGVLQIDRIVPGQGDFTPGQGPRLLEVPGLPSMSPLICYEAIFPGRVTPRGERPGWLLNLTNDAWFGTFAGPRQHFAIAIARAVEEGLPMVRAANTGISAVVDAHGRTVARLGIGERGVLDSGLPTALPPTPFARWGEAIPTIVALLLLGFALGAGRRRKGP